MSVAANLTKQWRCLQCRRNAARAFSTTTSTRAVGPEHPQYIDVPQAPQQTAGRAERVRGTLPVPRELFRGKQSLKEAMDKRLANSTRVPEKVVEHKPSSREAYNVRLAEARRSNLQEGTRELRRRLQRSTEILQAQREEIAVKRQAALYAPERDDEKLTAGSTNIDLKNYIQLKLTPRERRAKIRESKLKYNRHMNRKERELSGQLHTLYTHARTFIVNQEQLDEAIEHAFGTDESPVVFSNEYGIGQDAHSIWALGRPAKLQEMAAMTAGTARNQAMGSEDINVTRINRVAEVLTGGEFGKSAKDQPSS